MKHLLMLSLVWLTACNQTTQADIEREANKQLQEKEDCKDAAKTLNLLKSEIVRQPNQTPYCLIYVNDNGKDIAISLSEARFMVRLDGIKKSLKRNK